MLFIEDPNNPNYDKNPKCHQRKSYGMGSTPVARVEIIVISKITPAIINET
jgi:hypothetical protein